MAFSNFVYYSMYYRLLIQKHLQENRHVAEIPIKPVFIIGMFRTGTTLLYNCEYSKWLNINVLLVLAQDPASRAPRSWEMTHPMPPPEKDTKSNDWRIVDAKRKAKLVPTDFNVNRCIYKIWLISPFITSMPKESKRNSLFLAATSGS